MTNTRKTLKLSVIAILTRVRKCLPLLECSSSLLFSSSSLESKKFWCGGGVRREFLRLLRLEPLLDPLLPPL